MAECDWAILCDYAFLDVGRKTCMIGVFDRVFAQSVPSQLHQSALALKLLAQPGEKINFKIEIIRPTQGSLASLGGTVAVSETGAVEMQLMMAGLPLPDYGLYNLNVLVDGNLLKTVGFVVVQPPAQQPHQPA